MKKILLVAMALSSAIAHAQINVQHLGADKSIIRYKGTEKYILLPIEESAPEVRVDIVRDNQLQQSLWNIRLSRGKVDYYAPLSIEYGVGQHLTVSNMPDSALCWSELKLSDKLPQRVENKYRSLYHFTPEFGWMNDPNGMYYQNGLYHLYYQHNPYGAVWGNMHWGHATSKDLIHWEHQPEAIAPDMIGAIFSGSCVVDKDNTAGFGKDAVIAFYTSAGDRQTQSMAYSLDGGMTFTKYKDNPILVSNQPDFRDPKVIWHEPTKMWVMLVAVGQEMQFYVSKNLKEWSYTSSFGKEYGNHGGVWECPDLIEMPVEGTHEKKWMLFCNINPGGPFGGSATQYFIGEFDGKVFTTPSSKATTKWLDYGKDHYAAVTWHNSPDKKPILIAWMSNWQYANQVPTKAFRSANTIARELSLYKSNDGEYYAAANPIQSMKSVYGKAIKVGSVKLNNSSKEITLPKGLTAYELQLDLDNQTADKSSIEFLNAKGERVVVALDAKAGVLSVDRTKSGLVGFSAEFPAVTSAPTSKKALNLRIFVDKSSIEVFGDEGRANLTNIVFPTEPYIKIRLVGAKGKTLISNAMIYPLNVK